MQKYKRIFQDEQKAIFINRIINEFSHLEETTERPKLPIVLKEIQEASKIVIETIKRNNEEQYKALVESIKESRE